MDDELEDKVFYQTYVSHMKILSKFAVGVSSINSPLAYFWKICRLYILRPEFIFFCVILLLVYLQTVHVWSRSIFGRLQATFGRHKSNRIKVATTSGDGDQQCWEELRQQSAAYALLGRRPRMEDRFIIEENINNTTGISFFAIFDGHGGEFAADFARDILVQNIYNKVIASAKLLQQQPAAKVGDGAYDVSPYLKRKQIANRIGAGDSNDEPKSATAAGIRRRDSLRKTQSTTDDCSSAAGKQQQQQLKAPPTDIFTSKLNSLMRGSGKDAIFNNNNALDGDNANGPPPSYEAKCYIENGKINFGKLITDEIMSADYRLVEAAKKTTNIAGTTALIAIIHGSKLIVANVGDSRGVMCDSRGMAIPLSFDHKPQQVRERKRIIDAGGFIAFRGVWRVAGILATSRALGDYPLKDKNLVIATPDILTFELNQYKPNFLILASDGLWDTFSNEEACSYITEHINEADFGAKSLALQSYQRGSVDNITVLIIVFKNGNYRISAASAADVVAEAEKVAEKAATTLKEGVSVKRTNSINAK